jgi:threonine aldolase
MIAISAFLQTARGCNSAETGHIEVHETGAIESTGHKILGVKITTASSAESKLHVLKSHPTSTRLSAACTIHTTELGGSMADRVGDLSAFCRENGCCFIWRSRLGSALCSRGCDLNSRNRRAYGCVLYPAAKNGALLGEALVW